MKFGNDPLSIQQRQPYAVEKQEIFVDYLKQFSGDHVQSKYFVLRFCFCSEDMYDNSAPFYRIRFCLFRTNLGFVCFAI